MTARKEKTSKKWTVNKDQFVIIEVGKAKGCIGRAMSYDEKNNYVKVRLAGASLYNYAPTNLRRLVLGTDLPSGTRVIFRNPMNPIPVPYTVKKVWSDEGLWAVVHEVPYRVNLEGWGIEQLMGESEELNAGEKQEHKELRQGVTFLIEATHGLLGEEFERNLIYHPAPTQLRILASRISQILKKQATAIRDLNETLGP